MKQIQLLFLCIGCCFGQVLPAQSLSERLQNLIDQSPVLETSDAGILVYDLTDSDEVYRYRAEKLFHPASVEKVVTAITALATLDSTYAFDTRLAYTGLIKGGVLQGDLYVAGDFDPLFDETDLQQMIEAVKRAGIREVRGRLIGDASLMDSLYWGPGWAWDDTPETYQPYLSPLMLNRGCITVSLTPRSKGESAEVEIRPVSDYYRIDNRTQSRMRSADKLRVTRDWVSDGNTIRLTGNVGAPAKRELNLYGSKEFFLHTLRYQLEQADVMVSPDSLSFAECPTDTIALYHNLRNLREVMKHALKESDNLAAEAIYFHLARHHANDRKGLGFRDGRAAIEHFMKKQVRSNPKKYRIRDGSGMSTYNYLSPELIVNYLKYTYRHPHLFNVLYDCLPVAGVDGTLWYRMKRGKAFRNVHAKTGTLSAVSTLAGYVTAPDGHLLAFAIMNQNVLDADEARAFQNKVCEVLASHPKNAGNH